MHISAYCRCRISPPSTEIANHLNPAPIPILRHKLSSFKSTYSQTRSIFASCLSESSSCMALVIMRQGRFLDPGEALVLHHNCDRGAGGPAVCTVTAISSAKLAYPIFALTPLNSRRVQSSATFPAWISPPLPKRSVGKQWAHHAAQQS